MTINTAIITADCITTLDQPVDSLLDAMIEAQNRVGQITWDDISAHRAAGTYRAGTIAVVDTGADAALRGAVAAWMTRP